MTARTVSKGGALGEDLPAAAEMTTTGPLWADAYAVTWPRSGGDGACSHQPPDACPDCDGTAAEQREARSRARRVRSL